MPLANTTARHSLITRVNLLAAFSNTKRRVGLGAPPPIVAGPPSLDAEVELRSTTTLPSRSALVRQDRKVPSEWKALSLSCALAAEAAAVAVGSAVEMDPPGVGRAALSA